MKFNLFYYINHRHIKLKNPFNFAKHILVFRSNEQKIKLTDRAEKIVIEL